MVLLNAKKQNKMARPKGISRATALSAHEEGNAEFHQEPIYIPSDDSTSEVVTESANIIFRLVDNNKKGAVNIDCEDYVINPKFEIKGEDGKITYEPQMDSIHLLVGENEIWGSKLKEKYGANFADIVRKSKRLSLRFESRTLVIPSWDTPAIEFLRHHRSCIDNKLNKVRGRISFYEYNPMREAQLAEKRMSLEMDAMAKISVMDEAKVKKLSIYLGLPLNDTLGEAKPLQLLRVALFSKMKAYDDPQKFIGLFEDESVDINYLILKAIKDSKIDISQTTSTGKIHWATGGLIVSSNGRVPKDALLELALSKTPAGNDFLEQLKRVTQ